MNLPINEIEKEQINKLLDELSEIKGPQQLPEWNIKARTLLVFLACKNPVDKAFLRRINDTCK